MDASAVSSLAPACGIGACIGGSKGSVRVQSVSRCIRSPYSSILRRLTLVIVHGSCTARRAAFLRAIDHVYHGPNLICSLQLHINGPAIRFLEVGDKVLEIDGTARDQHKRRRA